MRKEQQCKENTAFICRCVRRVHEHQIHNQLIKICFVGKYGSIEPIYFTSRSRIYDRLDWFCRHLNIYHMSMFMVDMRSRSWVHSWLLIARLSRSRERPPLFHSIYCILGKAKFACLS